MQRKYLAEAGLIIALLIASTLPASAYVVDLSRDQTTSCGATDGVSGCLLETRAWLYSNPEEHCVGDPGAYAGCFVMHECIFKVTGALTTGSVSECSGSSAGASCTTIRDYCSNSITGKYYVAVSTCRVFKLVVDASSTANSTSARNINQFELCVDSKGPFAIPIDASSQRGDLAATAIHELSMEKTEERIEQASDAAREIYDAVSQVVEDNTGGDEEPGAGIPTSSKGVLGKVQSYLVKVLAPLLSLLASLLAS